MEDNYFPIEFGEDAQTFTVVNTGTAPTPCKMTVIPKVDFLKLEIQGLSDEPLVFIGLKANQTLEIDGENRLVAVDGEPAFLKYDCWEFPRLKPGANQIQIVNGTQLTIQIEFNPRFI